MTEMAARGEAFLKPRFERALARAGHTHDWLDVVPRLLDGRAQYWGSEDGRGAIVTELLVYPKLKAVSYWLAAGELQSCLALVPTIEDWARAEGCTRALGQGRPGFARLLGPSGVTVAGYSFRKELVR